MALSDKHYGKRLVPWFSSEEWRMVYEKLYNDSDVNSKKIAYRIIQIWKCRMSLLPAGVDMTLILLDAMLIDQNLDTNKTCILQAACLMRFLNILTSAYDSRHNSFFATAKQLDIPDWVIKMRHDFAHSQVLPVAEMLQRALEFCFDFVKNEYWVKEAEFQKNYIAENAVITFDNEATNQKLAEEMERSVKNCAKLLYYYNFKNIHFLQHLQDEEMLAELKSLDDMFINNLRTTDVVKRLNGRISELAKEDAGYKSLVKSLLQSDIFVYSLNDSFDIIKEANNVCLPRKFVNMWAEFLQFLYKINCYQELIFGLLKIVNDDEESDERRKVSALWLKELSLMLWKCYKVRSLIREKKEELSYYSEKELQERSTKEVVSANKSLVFSIDLDVKKPMPQIFQNFEEFAKVILEIPNKYTLIFFSSFMNYLKIVPSSVSSELGKLIQTTIQKQFEESDSKVYTVDDMKKLLGGEISEEEEISVNVPSQTKKWRKVIDPNLCLCPLGVLPGQSRTVNSLLPFFE